MKRYTPEILSDMDSHLVKLVGADAFKALKVEFVDLINDLRVASVSELVDLGLPRDAARDVLYYVQHITASADPTCKQRVTEITFTEKELEQC